MNNRITLIVASLLAALLLTIHMSDDVVLGYESGQSTLAGVPIVVLWLVATLLLDGQRLGYALMVLAALLGIVVPVVHMREESFAVAAERSGHALLFVWTLVALGVTSGFMAVLALRALVRWRLPRVGRVAAASSNERAASNAEASPSGAGARATN